MKIIDRRITLSILLATIFGVAVISLALVRANVFNDLMINQNLPPGLPAPEAEGEERYRSIVRAAGAAM
jgi:hypothetical protein